MSKEKKWATGDRAAAIGWIMTKADTVVFEAQRKQIIALLEELKIEADPSSFGRKAQEMMDPDAYRRMLGAIRQTRHISRAA